ncbi:hypothetical protein AGMMS49936_01550 [Endomicrobiia bacterium]|nr:hypothetical protein AGMMS49936_01550 [Endomicrobiia bacterium]
MTQIAGTFSSLLNYLTVPANNLYKHFLNSSQTKFKNTVSQQKHKNFADETKNKYVFSYV